MFAFTEHGVAMLASVLTVGRMRKATRWLNSINSKNMFSSPMEIAKF